MYRSKPRLLPGIIAVLSLAGFILSMLALFAGDQKGFMMDFDIARLNTSGIGQDLISTGSDDKNERRASDEDDGGFFDGVKDTFDDVKDDAVDGVNDIVGDAVDEATQAIGIADWYSFHMLEICEGYWKANGHGLNTTKCTNTSPGNRFNVTKLLDKEISAGPVDINLADLGWSDDIQEYLDFLNKALLALFVIFVIGVGSSGVAAILGVLAAALLPSSSLMKAGYSSAVFLSTTCLMIGSAIISGVGTLGVDKVNDLGKDFGLSAISGTKILGLAWGATGSMFLATAVLVPLVFQWWKNRKNNNASAMQTEK